MHWRVMFWLNIHKFLVTSVFIIKLKNNTEIFYFIWCLGIICFSLHEVSGHMFPGRPRPENVQVTAENQHKVLMKRITPYHNKSYEAELELKQSSAWKVVKTIRERLLLLGTEIPDFPVERIVPSPEINRYRNKDDFSVYYGVDGRNTTVGYLSGTPSLPGCVAVPPTHLAHIKDSHKRLASLFEDYIKDSPYRVCYHFRGGGFWKRLSVRSNEAGDLMAIIITHPYALTTDEMAQERLNLTQYFLRHEPNIILYHQECAKVDCSNDVASYTRLAGKSPCLLEKMGNLTFQITSHSFFQVNKRAAEQMVESIWNWMNVTTETTFVDLYCGVGLYSIMGSHRVNSSIGIEMLEGAVSDARKNAELNNITNCEFIAGRVEDNLSHVLKKTYSRAKQVLALLNPGRAGATKRVVTLLREDKRIKKLIFVACKPDNRFTMSNFIQLCRKGGHMRGTPFHIKNVRLFDLFPRTLHYEMILEFNR